MGGSVRTLDKSKARIDLTAGTIVGTVFYLAPEQAIAYALEKSDA